jgi:hypothetical protein
MEYIAHKAVWFPDRITLAGYRLAPPTLGQIRLLEAVNSPYMAGGEVEPLDSAIALYILATPWRRARRRLAKMPRMVWLAHWMLLRRAVRDPGLPNQISAVINHALWAPERYIPDAEKQASAFEPSTGWAVLVAIRACRLPLSALCHEGRADRRDSGWSCVWDVPVQALMAYGVAEEETKGREFQTREETEGLLAGPRQRDRATISPELNRHGNGGENQPRDQQDLQHAPDGLQKQHAASVTPAAGRVNKGTP